MVPCRAFSAPYPPASVLRPSRPARLSPGPVIEHPPRGGCCWHHGVRARWPVVPSGCHLSSGHKSRPLKLRGRLTPCPLTTPSSWQLQPASRNRHCTHMACQSASPGPASVLTAGSMQDSRTASQISSSSSSSQWQVCSPVPETQTGLLWLHRSCHCMHSFAQRPACDLYNLDHAQPGAPTPRHDMCRETAWQAHHDHLGLQLHLNTAHTMIGLAVRHPCHDSVYTLDPAQCSPQNTLWAHLRGELALSADLSRAATACRLPVLPLGSGLCPRLPLLCTYQGRVKELYS